MRLELDRMPLHPLQTWGLPRRLALAAEGTRLLQAVVIADALVLLGRPGGPPVALILVLLVTAARALPSFTRRLEQRALDHLGDVVPGPRPERWASASSSARAAITTAGVMGLAANSGSAAGTVLIFGAAVFALGAVIDAARVRRWAGTGPQLVAATALLVAAAL